MKNNLEEVLKEKMSIDMSSPIKFLRTMRLSHYEIPSDFMLDMHDQLDKLEQELQKTREQLIGVTEQLEKCEKLAKQALSIQKDNYGDGSTTHVLLIDWAELARQYFKDKQSEG